MSDPAIPGVLHAAQATRLLSLLLAGGDKSSQDQGHRIRLATLAKSSQGVTRCQRRLQRAARKIKTAAISTSLTICGRLKTWRPIWRRGSKKLHDDAAGIARALGDIARAKGMGQVAKRRRRQPRELVSCARAPRAIPSLATILKGHKGSWSEGCTLRRLRARQPRLERA